MVKESSKYNTVGAAVERSAAALRVTGSIPARNKNIYMAYR